MRVIKSFNPLCLADDTVIADIHGQSPKQVIETLGLVFDQPFICLVNGKPWGRDDWNQPVRTGWVIHFVILPRGGNGKSDALRIVAMIVVAVLSYYTGGLAPAAWGALGKAAVSGAVMGIGSLLVNAMFPLAMANMASSDPGQAETVYSIDAGANTIGIGSPFAEHFGRIISYPNLVQIPYTSFEDMSSFAALHYLRQIPSDTIVLADEYTGEPGDYLASQLEACDPGLGDQYFYFLGIIGVGEYEIEGIYVDDTPLADFDGSAYRILPPGTQPMLVPRLCWTCDVFGNQELTTTWLTGVMSGPGVKGADLEFDILFPNGLIAYNDGGDRLSCQVAIEAEVRRVDWQGNGISEWTTLYSREYSFCTIEALRFSHRVAAPLGFGRYELRIKRTSEPSTEGQVSDKCYINGARVFGAEHLDYGNVTCVECRIRANDQLNGQVANKMRVVATRMLEEVTATGLAASKTATRSIVDAAVYVVTSDNGGMYPLENIDFPALALLRTSLENSNYHYDWRHSSTTTVIDTVKQMGALGRCLPYTPGGIFTLIQDKLQALPAISFSEDDYTADSLLLEHTIPTDESYTCVVVTYTDPETWNDMEVICHALDGSEQRPYKVNLPGCTDRQHAYEIGMYLYNDENLCRTTVEFETGLKGHLPQPGAKMVVSANMVDWGQTGKVVDTDGTKWLLSEPVDFQGEASGQLFVTDNAGAALGPITVTPTDHTHIIKGLVPSNLRTLKEYGMSGVSYLFGPASQEWLYIRFLTARFQGQNKIKIIGDVIYDEVYEHPGTAPAPGTAPVLMGYLSWMSINYLSKEESTYRYYVTWIGSAESFRIEVDEGDGYVLYQDLLSSHNCLVLSSQLNIQVRISPYLEGVLRSDLAIIDQASLMRAENLAITPGILGVEVEWADVTGATQYDLELISTGNVTLKHYATTNSYYFIPMTDLVAAHSGPEFILHLSVIGQNAVDPITETVILPAPGAPANFTLIERQGQSVNLAWSAVAGAKEYAVWMGDSADFIPSAENLIYKGTATSGIIPTGSPGTNQFYFKLAALTEIFTSDSPELLNMANLEILRLFKLSFDTALNTIDFSDESEILSDNVELPQIVSTADFILPESGIRQISPSISIQGHQGKGFSGDCNWCYVNVRARLEYYMDGAWHEGPWSAISQVRDQWTEATSLQMTDVTSDITQIRATAEVISGTGKIFELYREWNWSVGVRLNSIEYSTEQNA